MKSGVNMWGPKKRYIGINKSGEMRRKFVTISEWCAVYGIEYFGLENDNTSGTPKKSKRPLRGLDNASKIASCLEKFWERQSSENIENG